VESMGGARLKARETPPDVWAIVPLVMKGPTTVLTHRGLSPRQFTPMSGAHEADTPNPAMTSLFQRGRHGRRAGDLRR
jgi:hypothetical protein